MAEGVGFEPTRALRALAIFKIAAIAQLCHPSGPHYFTRRGVGNPSRTFERRRQRHFVSVSRSKTSSGCGKAANWLDAPDFAGFVADQHGAGSRGVGGDGGDPTGLPPTGGVQTTGQFSKSWLLRIW